MKATQADLPGDSQDVLSTRPAIILLVEDERFVRDVAAEILQSAGYKVLKARTASEALRTFRRSGEHVDLLITDVVLPGKNGCGLSDELASQSPGMVTIFISGYPENVMNLNGKNRSSFYLAKPFTVDSLIKKVQQALAAGAAPAKPLAKSAACSG